MEATAEQAAMAMPDGDWFEAVPLKLGHESTAVLVDEYPPRRDG